MCHDAQTVYGIQLAFLPSTDNAPHLNELSALRNTFCTRKERILYLYITPKCHPLTAETN